tara:strand:+ start:186 stop:488 length:303 start_codon:yes stop_codon:yes gene_type:complete
MWKSNYVLNKDSFKIKFDDLESSIWIKKTDHHIIEGKEDLHAYATSFTEFNKNATITQDDFDRIGPKALGRDRYQQSKAKLEQYIRKSCKQALDEKSNEI